MDLARRTLLTAGVIALGACATRLSNEFDYEERFDSLAISPDGEALVVVGREFDYVFRPPRPLVAAIQSDLRPKLSADFQKFELNSPAEIRGQWLLHFNDDNPKSETVIRARGLGFTEGGASRYVLSGSISGTRYLRNNAKRVGSTQATNRPYTVLVSRSRSFTEKQALERSPVSQDSNGVLILGIILLLPLLLIIQPCITCK